MEKASFLSHFKHGFTSLVWKTASVAANNVVNFAIVSVAAGGAVRIVYNFSEAIPKNELVNEQVDPAYSQLSEMRERDPRFESSNPYDPNLANLMASSLPNADRGFGAREAFTGQTPTATANAAIEGTPLVDEGANLGFVTPPLPVRDPASEKEKKPAEETKKNPDGTDAGAGAATNADGTTAAGTDGGFAVPNPAATIEIADGDGQSAFAGTALTNPLKVILKDSLGNPTGGKVSWAVASGSGVLSTSTSTVSPTDGLAAATLTLGETAATNTVTATVIGTALSVTFSATGTAGSATQIAISSGNNQTGTAGSALSSAFSVIVKDSRSNVVNSATITWAVVTGSGTLSVSSSTTGTNGIASSTLTLGTSQISNTVTATISGTSTSVTFTASGTTLSDSSSNTLGFGGGTFFGTAYSSSKLILASANSCDATSTNCSSLDSSWTPQFSSIVAYWKMDNSFADAVGSNTGTANNGATFTTSAKIGTHAGSFDGVNDYVSVSDSTSLDLSTNLSIAMWIKPTSISANPYVIAKGVSGGKAGYGIQLKSTGDLVFSIRDDNSDQDLAASNTDSVFTGVWQQIIITYAAGSVKFYRNAQLLATVSAAGTSLKTDGGGLQIGSLDGTADFFTGSIDDVAIWNTALSATEVRQIYDRQSAKYSGLFTSRVIDNLSSTSWSSFTWATTLPFYKEIPNGNGSTNSETSTAYSSLVGTTGSTSDNDSLTGLIGTWHFNGADASIASGTTISDASSLGNTATTSDSDASATMKRIPGVLGDALLFNGADDAVDADGVSNDLATNAGTGSFAVWVRRDFTDGDNTRDRYIFQLFADANNQIDWFYDTTADNIAFSFVGNGTTVAGATMTEANLSRGEWHHLVATWSTTADQIKIYLDGVQTGATVTGLTALTSTPTNFTMGNNTVHAKNWQGPIDEATLWSRALTATEVKQLYRRGANRVKFQLRTCSDSTCSTGPSYVSPGGGISNFFSERHNNTVIDSTSEPTGSFNKAAPTLTFTNFTSTSLTSAEYIQYRIVLESDDPAGTPTSPQVTSVTVTP